MSWVELVTSYHCIVVLPNHSLSFFKAVEYLSEWALCPTNQVFQRIQTGVYDPSLIGDKAKWYAQQLQRVDFHVYDNSSSLGAALTSVSKDNSDNPTDESGSDSDGADSNSSSYSSLSDFVSDLYNSDIRGETPCKSSW